MNLSKYRMAGNLFNFEYFSFKSKNQHICFHGNHGSNVGVVVVSVADSYLKDIGFLYGIS